MQLRDFIQRVQSLYSHGVQSRDTRLTSRHIYSAGMTARSILLRQRSNKNQAIGNSSYQILPCVELEKAAVHDCPCIPAQGCMILRTKYKLPDFIVDLNSEAIKYVMSLDGSLSFDRSTFEDEKYSKGNKYTATKPKFFIKDQRIYISVLKQLKGLTLSGLFNDIIEANSFPSLCPCEGCDCIDPLDMELPIDGDLIKPMLQLSNDELIVMMKQIVEDKKRNSSDDTTTTGAMIHQQPQQEQ